MTDLTRAGSLLERTCRYVAGGFATESVVRDLLTELHDRIVELTPPASHSGYTQMEWTQLAGLDRYALMLADIHERSAPTTTGGVPFPTPLLLIELAEFIHHCPVTLPMPGNELRYSELREILREKTENIHGDW